MYTTHSVIWPCIFSYTSVIPVTTQATSTSPSSAALYLTPALLHSQKTALPSCFSQPLIPCDPSRLTLLTLPCSLSPLHFVPCSSVHPWYFFTLCFTHCVLCLNAPLSITCITSVLVTPIWCNIIYLDVFNAHTEEAFLHCLACSGLVRHPPLCFYSTLYISLILSCYCYLFLCLSLHLDSELFWGRHCFLFLSQCFTQFHSPDRNSVNLEWRSDWLNK